MKKLMAILILAVWCGSCAAQNFRIQKVQAFYTVTMPGMARADENGNTIDPQPIIDRFIYMECAGSIKPKIDALYYGGTLFAATIQDKAITELNVGVNKLTGKAIQFVPKKGNKVWKVYIVQNGNVAVPPVNVKNIIIKGSVAKKTFTASVKTETELTAPDRY